MTYTMQQAFDKVVAHCNKQGGRSKKFSGRNVFRSAEGRSCAIGCFIRDEDYNLQWDDVLVDNNLLFDDLEFSNAIRDIRDLGLQFCLALQRLHDVPQNWITYQSHRPARLKRLACRAFAKQWGLACP